MSVLSELCLDLEVDRVLSEGQLARHYQLERYQDGLISEHPAAQHLTTVKLSWFRQASLKGYLVDYHAYLTCTSTPSGRRRKWQSLSPDEFARRKAQALDLRERLMQALEKAGFDPIPLFDQGLFSLLWRYFNPGGQAAPRYLQQEQHYPGSVLNRLPALAPPTLRSQLLESDLARRWDYLWFSGHYAKLLSLGSLPVGHTQAGMLGELLTLPRRYWLLVDFVHEPYGPTLRALMAQARRLYAATGDTGGLSDYADPNVRVGFKEVDEALA